MRAQLNRRLWWLEDRVFDKNLAEGLLEECEDPPPSRSTLLHRSIEAFAAELSVVTASNEASFFLYRNPHTYYREETPLFPSATLLLAQR